MIDGREKPSDVAFQSMYGSCIIAARLAQKNPEPFDGGMRALPNATRITVMNKLTFEKQLDNVHDSLMHNPILHCSLVDSTLLRIENSKRLVGIVTIFAGGEAVTQRE